MRALSKVVQLIGPIVLVAFQTGCPGDGAVAVRDLAPATTNLDGAAGWQADAFVLPGKVDARLDVRSVPPPDAGPIPPDRSKPSTPDLTKPLKPDTSGWPTFPDIGAQPEAGSGCQPLETPYNGWCYWVTGVKWIDIATAKQLCAGKGGRIASIHSAAENAFVYSIMPQTTQGAWIGLSRNNGKWVWSDGSVLSGYQNWAQGEPNNEGGREDCVVLWGPALNFPAMRSRWNDLFCGNPPGRDAVVCMRRQ